MSIKTKLSIPQKALCVGRSIEDVIEEKTKIQGGEK